MQVQSLQYHFFLVGPGTGGTLGTGRTGYGAGGKPAKYGINMSPCHALENMNFSEISCSVKAKIFLYDSFVGQVGTGAGGVPGVGVGGELFMYNNN